MSGKLAYNGLNIAMSI